MSRLKRALGEAQAELSTALLQSSNKFRRLQLVTSAVNRMADQAQDVVARAAFQGWADVAALKERVGDLCARTRRCDPT